MQRTNEMFTGLKAKEMIGAPARVVRRPLLHNYRVFIQNGGGGSRCLKPGTSLLYEVYYTIIILCMHANRTRDFMQKNYKF